VCADIFKLSQGEYIRPEHIENVYVQSPFVKNIFVYGDSYRVRAGPRMLSVGR